MKKFFLVSIFLVLSALLLPAKGPAKKEAGQFDVHLSYTPSFMVVSTKYEYSGCNSIETLENSMMNGFNIGAGYAWNIWRKMFIGTGADLDFNFGSEKEDDGTVVSNNFIDLRVPVTVFYELEATEGFSLVPLAGIDFGCGLLGERVYKGKINETPIEVKDDYYGAAAGDDRFSRFIFDWHVGCKLKFADKFCIGYTFMSPVTNMLYHKEIEDNVKKITKKYRQNHFVTLSYIF